MLLQIKDFDLFQVIAFTCCCITVLLLLASTATSDWMLADGWREGLFMQCISVGAPTPLPFEMEGVPGCSKARSASKSVRHVTGWDKDYLRKIPRVVW